jgi:uncharacterized protein (DUF427 family)
MGILRPFHHFFFLSMASSSTSTSTRPVEDVWNYPRPAILEPCADPIRIVFNGVEVVNTTNGYRTLETSHAPTYYIPIADLSSDVTLEESAGGGSFCEWKGSAVYVDLVVGNKRSKRAGWKYPSPTTRTNPNQEHGWANYGTGENKGTGGSFAPLADCIAFYATKVDEVYVADEKSTPQDGGFYGGWINSWISGGRRGIKGAVGTSHY